jgi:RNA polymerase sigma factor (sigma-70 family)
VSSAEDHSAAAFVTTRWTQVLSARDETPEARAALSELCSAYYAPVLAFVRHETRDEQAARDLTHGFFSQLLGRRGLGHVEPGRARFRSYLIAAVKNFLIQEHQRQNAAKRGGGQVPLALEGETDTSTALQIADPGATPSDALFDREWASTLVERALAALTAECAAGGRGGQFEALKPWLVGEIETLSQAEAARQLGLSEGAVKVAIHRLRKRFRELVKAEIAQTVDDPAQVQEEMRYLVEVLSR